MDKRDIANELINRLKRLKPEEWELAKPWISDLFAQRRRGRFRVIPDGHSNKHEQRVKGNGKVHF